MKTGYGTFFFACSTGNYFFDDGLPSSFPEKQNPSLPKGDSPIGKREEGETTDKKKGSQKRIKDLNFIVRIDEAIELDDTIELDNTIELDDTIELGDTNELDDTNELGDRIELDGTIKLDDTIKLKFIKLDDTTQLEETVKLEGLEDYIVVESDGILLICKKQDEQQIRNFVNDVRVQKGERFV